jgi:hypothetical protein
MATVWTSQCQTYSIITSTNTWRLDSGTTASNYYYVDSGTTAATNWAIQYNYNQQGYLAQQQQLQQPQFPDRPPHLWPTREDLAQATILNAEKVEKVGEAAEEKAEKLLQDVLGDVMYHRYKKDGYIDIPSGKDINRKYRIRPHKMIGLLKKVDGKWEDENGCLCIHPAKHHAKGDDTLSKVLVCQNDEGLLWKVANHHRGMRAA